VPGGYGRIRRRCRATCRRSGGGVTATALSDLFASTDRLGRVLPLAARAAGARTDLDSSGSVRGVSTLACAVAGPGVGAAPRDGNGQLGTRLALKVVSGLGLRPIAEQLNLPRMRRCVRGGNAFRLSAAEIQQATSRGGLIRVGHLDRARRNALTGQRPNCRSWLTCLAHVAT
jgi:hypothetical protein